MRIRAVALATATSFASKVISVGTSLIAIPLAIDSLGNTRFGIWMVIASLPAFLVFMDFGIGNGVLNAVAAGNAAGDRDAIRKSFANGLAMLAIAASAFLAVFLAAWPWIDWLSVIGANASLQSLSGETRAAVFALGLIFFVSIPAGLAQRAFLGIQKGFIGGLWQIAASLLSFAGVVLVLRYWATIPGLVIAMFGVPALVAVVSAIHFALRERDLWPGMADLDKRLMIAFARTGGYFFLLQLAGAVAFASDQLIISHQLGVESVATYSIYQKLFSPVPLMLSFVLTPLWAAYADAHAKKDFAWIRRILGKSVLVGALGASALVIPTAIFSTWLVYTWLGNAVTPDVLLALCLAFWVVVESLGRCVAIFLNGVGMLREQLLIILIFVPLCLWLKLLLSERLGLYGVPLAIALSYIVTHGPGYYWILRKWFAANRGVPQ